MWMMGYSDGGGEINTLQDPFTGRKLRPLMPRPVTAAAAATATATPCLTRFHGTDLFALNHHLAMAEQNKRDLNTQQVVVSSRWNPTPEQLQTLEELYRRGTRTPSAEQIQQITAQLRRYGKIEGKNVFYWFQNHKARERQKRRRQLESFPDRDEHQPHSCNHDNNGDTRSEGANRTLFEVEQIKNWASPTNSSTPPQKSGEAEAECKADDGWVQFDDDAELQRRRNATWQMMNLSCSSPTNPIATSSTVTIPAIPSTLATATTTLQFNPQDFINILLEPYNSLNPPRRSPSASADAQTLQLFPIQSRRRRPNYDEDDHIENEDEEDEDSRVNSVNNNNNNININNNINASHVTPYQFFEFLPLKN